MNTKFYKISPEVPGALGEKTQFDKSMIPWKIIHLHTIFDGWLGSDLMNVSPCFFCTSELKNEILSQKLTGIRKFDPVETSLSDMFKELYPNQSLPEFFMLTLNGQPFKNDFGKTEKSKLIVSQTALDILQKFELSIAIIEEIESPEGP